MIIGRLKGEVLLMKSKRNWRKLNASNKTSAVNRFDPSLVRVGKYTYGGLEVHANNKQNKLIIGNYCSIGPKVAFILSSDHYLGHISTYPYKVMVMGKTMEGVSKGDIILDDDVWIGYGAIILSGVHIGQGAAIAAGAVVSRDVPPYAIVGGVPAQVIKYRFSPELVKELLEIDYGRLTKQMIEENIDALYEPLTDRDQMGWMPRKHG